MWAGEAEGQPGSGKQQPGLFGSVHTDSDAVCAAHLGMWKGLVAALSRPAWKLGHSRPHLAPQDQSRAMEIGAGGGRGAPRPCRGSFSSRHRASFCRWKRVPLTKVMGTPPLDTPFLLVPGHRMGRGEGPGRCGHSHEVTNLLLGCKKPGEIQIGHSPTSPSGSSLSQSIEVFLVGEEVSSRGLSGQAPTPQGPGVFGSPALRAWAGSLALRACFENGRLSARSASSPFSFCLQQLDQGLIHNPYSSP